MTPLTCHPRPSSLLPSQSSPPQHPALPKSGSGCCVCPPPSPGQALGTLPVPGCPHGVWAEWGCRAEVRGHRMAASGQGRKCLRSHCGCSLRFPRWQQNQPGVASHARPRAWLPPLPPATTGPSRLPRARQPSAGAVRCPPDRAVRETLSRIPRALHGESPSRFSRPRAGVNHAQPAARPEPAAHTRPACAGVEAAGNRNLRMLRPVQTPAPKSYSPQPAADPRACTAPLQVPGQHWCSSIPTSIARYNHHSPSTDTEPGTQH